MAVEQHLASVVKSQLARANTRALVERFGFTMA
jgi:hypothetical protein